MATLPEIAPLLSTIMTEAEAKTSNDTPQPDEPEEWEVTNLTALTTQQRNLLKSWLKWREAKFVPDPIDRYARLSPLEVAMKLKVAPRRILRLIAEYRRIREEALKGDEAFQPDP